MKSLFTFLAGLIAAISGHYGAFVHWQTLPRVKDNGYRPNPFRPKEEEKEKNAVDR